MEPDSCRSTRSRIRILRVTLDTLFGKVWYEGYDQPAYVGNHPPDRMRWSRNWASFRWRSGTLKGTIYALFLAVPIAIFAAICTLPVHASRSSR